LNNLTSHNEAANLHIILCAVTDAKNESTIGAQNACHLECLDCGAGGLESPGIMATSKIPQAQIFRGRAGQAVCQQLPIARSFSAFITVRRVKTLLNPNNSYFQNPQP